MANFSDNAKINKFKFYENNIESNITPNGKEKLIHRLKNIKPELCNTGYARFNWNNDICKHCNKEYGCISITYYNSNNQQSIYTSGSPNKPQIKKTIHSSIYCIGCFMTKHNSFSLHQNINKMEKRPTTNNKISYWKN